MLTRLIGAVLLPIALLFLGSSRFDILELSELQFELTWEEVEEDLCG